MDPEEQEEHEEEEQSPVTEEKQLSQRLTYLLLALLLVVLILFSNLLLAVLKQFAPPTAPSIASCALSVGLAFAAIKQKKYLIFNLLSVIFTILASGLLLFLTETALGLVNIDTVSIIIYTITATIFLAGVIEPRLINGFSSVIFGTIVIGLTLGIVQFAPEVLTTIGLQTKPLIGADYVVIVLFMTRVILVDIPKISKRMRTFDNVIDAGLFLALDFILIGYRKNIKLKGDVYADDHDVVLLLQSKSAATAMVQGKVVGIIDERQMFQPIEKPQGLKATLRLFAKGWQQKHTVPTAIENLFLVYFTKPTTN